MEKSRKPIGNTLSDIPIGNQGEKYDPFPSTFFAGEDDQQAGTEVQGAGPDTKVSVAVCHRLSSHDSEERETLASPLGL